MPRQVECAEHGCAVERNVLEMPRQVECAERTYPATWSALNENAAADELRRMSLLCQMECAERRCLVTRGRIAIPSLALSGDWQCSCIASWEALTPLT